MASDEATIDGLGAALEHIGLEPVSLRDRAGTVARFEQIHPAAIVMSVGRGPVDPLEVVAAIRATERGAVVPLLLMGSADPGEAISSPSEALEAGADYYFRLPTDLDYLAGRVAGWVGETHSTRPRPAQSFAEAREGLSQDLDLEAFHLGDFDQEAVTEHGLPTLDLLREVEARRIGDSQNHDAAIPSEAMGDDVHEDDEPTKGIFDIPDDLPRPEPRAPSRQVELALQLVREGERHRREGNKGDAIDAYWAASEIYILDERPDEAIALYKLILYLDPTRYVVARHGAEIALSSGRKKDALDMYRHTARALEEAGRLDEATLVLREMVHLSPSEPTLVLRLAAIESRSRRTAAPRGPSLGAWGQELDAQLEAHQEGSLPSLDVHSAEIAAADIEVVGGEVLDDEITSEEARSTREVAPDEIEALVDADRRVSLAEADAMIVPDTLEISMAQERGLDPSLGASDTIPSRRPPRRPSDTRPQASAVEIDEGPQIIRAPARSEPDEARRALLEAARQIDWERATRARAIEEGATLEVIREPPERSATRTDPILSEGTARPRAATTADGIPPRMPPSRAVTIPEGPRADADPGGVPPIEAPSVMRERSARADEAPRGGAVAGQGEPSGPDAVPSGAQGNSPSESGSRTGAQGGSPSGGAVRGGAQGSSPSGGAVRGGAQGSSPSEADAPGGAQGNSPSEGAVRGGAQGNSPSEADARGGPQRSSPHPGAAQAISPSEGTARSGPQGSSPSEGTARSGPQGSSPSEASSGRRAQGNSPGPAAPQRGAQGSSPSEADARGGAQANPHFGGAARRGVQGNSPSEGAAQSGAQGNSPSGGAASSGAQGSSPSGGAASSGPQGISTDDQNDADTADAGRRAPTNPPQGPQRNPRDDEAPTRTPQRNPWDANAGAGGPQRNPRDDDAGAGGPQRNPHDADAGAGIPQRNPRDDDAPDRTPQRNPRDDDAPDRAPQRNPWDVHAAPRGNPPDDGDAFGAAQGIPTGAEATPWPSEGNPSEAQAAAQAPQRNPPPSAARAATPTLRSDDAQSPRPHADAPRGEHRLGAMAPRPDSILPNLDALDPPSNPTAPPRAPTPRPRTSRPAPAVRDDTGARPSSTIPRDPTGAKPRRTAPATGEITGDLPLDPAAIKPRRTAPATGEITGDLPHDPAAIKPRRTAPATGEITGDLPLDGGTGDLERKHRRPRPEPSRITFAPLVPNHGKIERLFDALLVFSLASTQRVTGMLRMQGDEGLVFFEGHPAARRGTHAHARLRHILDRAGVALDPLVDGDDPPRAVEAMRTVTEAGLAEEDVAQAILHRHLEDGVLAALAYRGPWRFLQNNDVDIAASEIVKNRDDVIAQLVELLPQMAPPLELASHLGGTRARVRLEEIPDCGLSARDARFCSWLDGTKPLDVAAALGGLAMERAAAIALVLVAFGHGTSSGQPAAPEPPAPPPPAAPPRADPTPEPAPAREGRIPHAALGALEPRDRLRALAELVRTSDYFTILGVDFSASKLQIDEAHHHLRRMIEIESFEQDPAMRAMAREVVRSLDEARDVLKVPQLRAAYQRHLKP